MVWDAASMDIVEKLLEEDRLPNLKSVIEKGLNLRMILGQPNCQTPAALATLFTGIPSYENGIAGFYTPNIVKGESILSRRSSYNQRELHEYSIWNWAVAMGKTVSLVHVPFVRELKDYESSGYGIAVDGYGKRLTRGRVFDISSIKWLSNEAFNFEEAVLDIEGFSFNIHLYRQDSKQRVTVIYQNGADAQSVDMEIGEASIDERHSLILGEGIMVTVSALYKPGDSDKILLIFSGIYEVIDHKGGCISDFLNYTGTFEGEGFGRYYRKGEFGKTISQGGQGEAEAIFLKLLNQTAMHFEKASEYCIENYPADLMILYQPCIDEMSHEFIGFCDKNCELYEEKYYKDYWDCIISAYQMADRHLGAVLRLLPEDTKVVVASDHGMTSVSQVIYINELLRRNGMLEFDSRGEIDIAKTKAFFHPADNGSIFINTIDYKGGIVPQSMKQAVLDNLVDILESFNDPCTGKPIIKRIWKVYKKSEELRELFGDIFVEPSYGYCIKGDMSSRIIEGTNKSGNHHYNPDFSAMDGIFCSSENLDRYNGAICNTEVFAALCDLMG